MQDTSAEARYAWLPVWSAAAAMRAVRAAIVIPGLFAITYVGIGDVQMATFAAFGGFATLVLAEFGGTRRDKALAHLGLAVAGSVLLVVGTVVSFSTALTVIVTAAVTFIVLFAGMTGPTAAAGVTAALLAYVLPAASPGTVEMIPSRLAGWWLASLVATAAVVLLSPPPPENRLRAAASATATAVADQLAAALRGEASPAHRAAALDAKHQLLAIFTVTPYRQTGLATADQALANVVELLEWCTSMSCDAVGQAGDLDQAAPADRALFIATTATLRDVAQLLCGDAIMVDFDRLARCQAESAAQLRRLRPDDAGYRESVRLSFQARTMAAATYGAAADALIVAGRADPRTVAAQRRRWFGQPAEGKPVEGRLAGLGGALSVAARHASLRSVWLRNSTRGALALAASVAVADLGGVAHGFWVVLATLSVLRTNAASTRSAAALALLGTVAGFAVGAAVILSLGVGPLVLWVALPIAVLVAAYAPGTAPFAAGQAAFTVVVAILFNLLVPVGVTVDIQRFEAVAIGCAVSLVVGILVWPRGSGGVVGEDLSEAFHYGGAYLAQAAGWALGLRPQLPDAASSAVTAGLRLDEALRGFLAERGTKRLAKEDLWRLVGGAMRLRLIAHSLAGLPHPVEDPDPARQILGAQATTLAGWYDHLATQVGPPGHGEAVRLEVPVLQSPLDGSARDTSSRDTSSQYLSCTLWVDEHIQNLRAHLAELVGPAGQVSEQWRTPWWR
ncbi:MAG: FUSC family protein [Pseudonocardiaceae bacterium]